MDTLKKNLIQLGILPSNFLSNKNIIMIIFSKNFNLDDIKIDHQKNKKISKVIKNILILGPNLRNKDIMNFFTKKK